MPDVNLVAVLLCGVSSLLLGALWYAPPVFGRAWQSGVGLSDEAAAGGNMALIFGLAFLLSVAAAWGLAIFLAGFADWLSGLVWGAAAGLFFVATSFGISYLFERRSPVLWLINGGYHVLQFALFGLILGLVD